MSESSPPEPESASPEFEQAEVERAEASEPDGVPGAPDTDEPAAAPARVEPHAALDARRRMLRQVRRRFAREPGLVTLVAAELRALGVSPNEAEAAALREELVPTLDLLDHWIVEGLSGLAPREPELDGWLVPGKRVEVRLLPRGLVRLRVGEDFVAELAQAARVVVPALAAGNRVEWVLPADRDDLATALRAVFVGCPLEVLVGTEGDEEADMTFGLGAATGIVDLALEPRPDAAYVFDASKRSRAGVAAAARHRRGQGRLVVLLTATSTDLDAIAGGFPKPAAVEVPASFAAAKARGALLVFPSLAALEEALAGHDALVAAPFVLGAVAAPGAAGAWLETREWGEVSVWSRKLQVAEEFARGLRAPRVSVNDHVGHVVLPQLPEFVGDGHLGDVQLTLLTRSQVVTLDLKRGEEPRWSRDLSHARAVFSTRARGRVRALASSVRLALRALRS